MTDWTCPCPRVSRLVCEDEVSGLAINKKYIICQFWIQPEIAVFSRHSLELLRWVPDIILTCALPTSRLSFQVTRGSRIWRSVCECPRQRPRVLRQPRSHLESLEAGAGGWIPGWPGGGSHRLCPVPVCGGRLGGHWGPGGQEDHGLQTQHPRQALKVRRNIYRCIT